MFVLNSVVFEELVLLSLRTSSVILRRTGGGEVVDDKFVTLGEEMRELSDNKTSTCSESVL